MKRKELENIIGQQTHFSTYQLRKFFPWLTEKHLDYRQKTQKIDQIRRGWYRINGRTFQEEDLREIANHIYEPSYISLETALRYYNFIPEIVPNITSISIRKTQYFNGKVANFYYRSISAEMFWWYTIIQHRNHSIFIAEPEKAILDYLYYHYEMTHEEDFTEWRIDTQEVKNIINTAKIVQYSKNCPKKSVQERVHNFIAYVYSHAT